jgi:hypothetical protein
VVDVEAVLGDGQDAELDDETGGVEQHEQRGLPPHGRLGPVAVGPVAVHEVGGDGRDDGRDHRRLQLAVRPERQDEGVEHGVVDDRVGTADDAELERLADELVPPLRQNADQAHRANVRQPAARHVPTGAGSGRDHLSRHCL